MIQKVNCQKYWISTWKLAYRHADILELLVIREILIWTNEIQFHTQEICRNKRGLTKGSKDEAVGNLECCTAGDFRLAEPIRGQKCHDLVKLKMGIPMTHRILFLVFTLEKDVHLETCIRMFMAAKNRKQINCPWTVASMNK